MSVNNKSGIGFMIPRVYRSNLSAFWPIERQTALLSDGVPEWPAVALFDEAAPLRVRRYHHADELPEREKFCGTSTRREETIAYVAAVECLAFHESDFLAVLARLAARNTALVILSLNLTIRPGDVSPAVIEAAQALRRGRRAAGSNLPVGRAGAQASALARAVRVDAGIALIRDRWPLPSKEHPTAALVTEARLSLATIKGRLGNRPEAQRKHRLAAETAKRNRSRRQSDGK